MAFIKLPPAETPREALERITMETTALHTQLDARGQVLPDLLELGRETAELEAGMERSKAETYSNLRSYLASRTLACADEYCMLLELEIATMEERKKKTGGAITTVDKKFLKPLAMFFQEVENDSRIVINAFEQLDLRVESFNDPRKFLLQIRTNEPALLFIDLTTPKNDFALALIRTIRSMLGPALPIMAVVNADNRTLIDRLKAAGDVALVTKPILVPELARRLASYVTTDGIARILAMPPVPKIIGWHFEKLMPTLTELRSCLAVYDDNERQLKYYAETAQRYDDEIIQLVKTLRRSEEKLDLLQSLRMYGAANVRNLLVALRLTDTAKIKVFTFNPKTNLPTEDVRKLLSYAIRLVDHFGEGSRYQEIAFNCGIVFDLLVLHAQLVEDRKRPLLKLIDALFIEAMRKADQGFQLGKDISDLTLEKHVISTLMMRAAGKITMAIFFPEYTELYLDLEKRGVKPILRHLAEEKRFGITYNVVGALICQVAPALELANQAVLFCDYPFMLRDVAKEEESFALATLCQSL